MLYVFHALVYLRSHPLHVECLKHKFDFLLISPVEEVMALGIPGVEAGVVGTGESTIRVSTGAVEHESTRKLGELVTCIDAEI